MPCHVMLLYDGITLHSMLPRRYNVIISCVYVSRMMSQQYTVVHCTNVGVTAYANPTDFSFAPSNVFHNTEAYYSDEH